MMQSKAEMTTIWTDFVWKWSVQEAQLVSLLAVQIMLEVDQDHLQSEPITELLLKVCDAKVVVFSGRFDLDDAEPIGVRREGLSSILKFVIFPLNS